MCGISGVFKRNHNNSKNDFVKIEKIIDKLLNSVKLRGPDNTGKLKVENGFLGHTRLAIRDLSNYSNQPLFIKDRNSSFVYNGEIYNTSELLKKYSLNQERSDTLCLKSLFKNKGNMSFINELIGDFAIAYWDGLIGKLYLIRDQIGKKPLYYASFKNYFLFNSSIKGIQDVIKSNSIDNNGLTNYLVYGNMFDNQTIFQEIKQVMPGNILIWDSNSGKITFKKYFDFKNQIITNKFVKTQYSRLIKLLSETLEDVIQSHLCSDVPISLLLSSGIDSKVVSKYSLSSEIKAYTAEFKGNQKEVNDAKKFSNYYEELNHEIVNIKESNVFNILEKIIEFIGEPFADASIIPLFCLYSNLPKDRKVVLQGDGGDELFGGYRRYQTFKLLSKLPKNKLYKFTSKFLKANHRLQRIIYLSSFNDEELYKNIMTTDFESINTISFFKNYLAEKKVNTKECYGKEYSRDFINTNNLRVDEKISAIDFMNQLPNQFLYKVDRVSMMCGIEARVPLVDTRLLKLVFSIPPKLRFKTSPPKKLLRDSVNIPAKFKYTPKRGFGTPIAQWLSNSKDYLKENMLSDSFIDYFMLDKNHINNLINLDTYSPSESYCLWKILCLSIWFKKVFKSNY